jgi:hypothetical protein
MTSIDISARSIRRTTIETALQSASGDRETLTPAELIEAANDLEHRVSHRFADVASAMRASARDMVAPVAITDVLASYDSGMLRDEETYERESSRGTADDEQDPTAGAVQR